MPTPPPPPPGSKYPPLVAVEGHKPSGKVAPLGWPLALVSLLILPPVVAFIYQKTAHFGLGLFSSMWFLVGAALLLGLAVGMGFYPAIQLGKIRNPTGMAVIGLLAGIATFGLALYFEADDHRAEVARGAQGSPIALVGGYLGGRAEVGQQVTGRGARRGANISGGMFWALIGIEGLLCSIGAAVAANVLASRRYSEEHGRWMRSKTLFTFPTEAAPPLVALANAGDWANFAAQARAAKAKENNLANVTVYTTHDQPGGVLQIRAVVNPKQPIATVYEKLLTPAELNVLGG